VRYEHGSKSQARHSSRADRLRPEDQPQSLLADIPLHGLRLGATGELYAQLKARHAEWQKKERQVWAQETFPKRGDARPSVEVS
jgi:hypothetical protein